MVTRPRPSIFNSLRTLAVALLLAGGCALIVSPASAAAPTLDEITGQLQIGETVAGEFVQRKFLTILPQPLQSSGQFAFQPDTGLEWETRQPLHSKLTFSAEGILQEQNGQKTWLARADQPGVAVIGQIMTAILTRDWDTLEAFFTLDIAPADTSGQWTLMMTPKQSTLATVISRIALSGDQHLRQMILLEQGGERTEIDFIPATGHPDTPPERP